MEEKMKELMASEEFLQKMLACEEPEQVQALFAAEGVTISLDEVKAIGAALAQVCSEGDELNEDDLEDVAGGVSINTSSMMSIMINPLKEIMRSKTARFVARLFRRW